MVLSKRQNQEPGVVATFPRLADVKRSIAFDTMTQNRGAKQWRMLCGIGITTEGLSLINMDKTAKSHYPEEFDARNRVT